MELASILVTLDVFGKLEVGDTLTWYGDTAGTPNIQKFGPWRSMRRSYNGDCREIMLVKVKEVIAAALELCNGEDHARLRLHLLSAMTGLKNLQKTYLRDSNVVATLEIVIGDMSLKLSDRC